MKLRHLLFAAVMVVTAATQAGAEGFSDNSIGARYGTAFKEPGIASPSQPNGANIAKLILDFNHFDVWNYGSNFFNIDALFSADNDPSNNSTNNGATEFYAVYRGQLSPDKIFGLNTKFGPFQAINFEAGVDLNTKNTAFAPAKRLLVIGPNFHFAVPEGFFDLGVHAAHEWNYNGIVGKHVDFNTTAEFEAVWLFPLSFTHLPLDFRGFANFVLPKGKDGFGNKTVAEILARPQLNLDVGKLAFNKPHVPDLYFAFEYWWNKFGNNHTQVPGSFAYTPIVGLEVHF